MILIVSIKHTLLSLIHVCFSLPAAGGMELSTNENGNSGRLSYPGNQHGRRGGTGK